MMDAMIMEQDHKCVYFLLSCNSLSNADLASNEFSTLPFIKSLNLFDLFDALLLPSPDANACIDFIYSEKLEICIYSRELGC